MLRLLVDTSAWLDLAKDLQGEALVTTLRVLEHERRIELLVAQLALDEFQRNRTRVATDMTRSTAAQLARAQSVSWSSRPSHSLTSAMPLSFRSEPGPKHSSTVAVPSEQACSRSPPTYSSMSASSSASCSGVQP